MSAEMLAHVDEADRVLVDVDTAQILEATLDVRPYEGDWDDDLYDRDEP